MGIRGEPSIPEMGEFQIQCSWFPNTPGKSTLPNPPSICPERGENQVNGVWKSDSARTGGVEKGFHNSGEISFPDATVTRWGNVDTKSNKDSMFSTGFEGTRFEAIPTTPSVDKFVSVGQNMWINSGCSLNAPVYAGDSNPSYYCFDLNSPCRGLTNALPSGNSSFLLAPITPDQSRKAESKQLINENSPCAAVSTEVQENHNLDTDDLQKTPQQQKSRRKKHRPKVVREGKPKRTPKPATTLKNEEKNPTGKRKYVRKVGVNKTPGLPTVEVTPDPAKIEETPKAKRKYVRKNGVNKTPSGVSTVEARSICTDTKTETKKRSCKKRLNFDDNNGPSIEESSLCRPASNGNAESQAPNFHIEIESGSPVKNLGASESDEHKRGKCRIVFSHQTHDKQGPTVEIMTQNNATQSVPSQNESNCCNKACSNRSNKACLCDGEEVKGLNPCLCEGEAKGLNPCLFEGEEAKGLKRELEFTINSAGQNCTNVVGGHYNSLSKYLALFPADIYDDNKVPKMRPSATDKKKQPKRKHNKIMSIVLPSNIAADVYDDDGTGSRHFSATTDKKRNSKKRRSTTTSIVLSSETAVEHNASKGALAHIPDSAYTASHVPYPDFSYYVAQHYSNSVQTETLPLHNAPLEQQFFDYLLAVDQMRVMTQMRCNVAPQVCNLVSQVGNVGSKQVSCYFPGGASSFGDWQLSEIPHPRPATTPKRVTTTRRMKKKRNSITNAMFADIARKENPTVDEVTEYLKHLHLEHPIHKEQNSLVLYHRAGTVVPFEGSFDPIKKRKPRAKVNIDAETNRVWRLLLENINSEGIDGTDEEKAKWWEEERQVFQGRADSFIARMHLVQGDRRFTPWKGSVVDSVVGVFLTQNVSDHLSSSAFMSLAANFPIKTKDRPCSKARSNWVKEQEVQILDPEDVISWPASNESYPSFTALLKQAENLRGCQYQETECTSSCAEKAQESMHQSENSTSSRPIVPSVMPDLGLVQVSLSSERLEEESQSSHIPTGSDENCKSEQSEVITVESLSKETVQEVFKVSIQEASESACSSSQEVVVNPSKESFDVTMNSCIIDNPNNTDHKDIMSRLNNHGSALGTDCANSEIKGGETGKQKQKPIDWDNLRLQAQGKGKRERTANTMDSVDWEAVSRADIDEVANTIKARGMNNKLAGRIQAFLNRLVSEHGSIDLEWLRDVPPDKAKEYLLSVRGLGLKSVECVRLLTLHHLAFPVDTNVGRIAVRLGWVPLQPLPESLQLHLLELYPVLESIQQYLWPRLCKLDQRTLYELHYQMITFGKVFCTKSKPNCNACPMRGECRHFASAFASARLALPGPEMKSIVSATGNIGAKQSSPDEAINRLQLPEPEPSLQLQVQPQVCICEPAVQVPTTIIDEEPIVEVPTTPPEPEIEVPQSDIEDALYDDPEEIPTIRLNIEKFTQNLQNYMEHSMELQEADVSKALVALTQEAASIPMPKLKNVNQLRTEHQVYELPDSHPLLDGLDRREPDDPCSYLLAIWTPGETANSFQQPESKCSSQESGKLCVEETCFSCNSIREANSQTVRGTLLIPCRTAMRGSFPLNGTYFQVNEVFADHESSIKPIDVPRSWIWNLPRRMVYFGTSIPTIFKGLSTESIQYCFWRGFVCVRGFDQKTRAPRPLMARLHFPASKLPRASGKTDDKKD